MAKKEKTYKGATIGILDDVPDFTDAEHAKAKKSLFPERWKSPFPEWGTTLTRKVIDFHQHLSSKISVPDLGHILDEVGVERSVVMPYSFGGLYTWEILLEVVGMNEKPEKYVSAVVKRLPAINQTTHQSIKHEKRFVFVPWISVINKGSDVVPATSPIVKVIPIFDQVPSLREYYTDMAAVLSTVQAQVVMIHSGWGALLDNEQYPLVRKLIAGLPEKRVVICHMKEDTDAYNFNRIKLLKEFENVYIETSYCPSPHRIQQYVELGFGDRMLFGSDFRTRIHVQTLRWFIAMITLCEIREASKRAILYGNAKKLLDGVGL